MQCPECGAPYTDADLFCSECGAVLPPFDAQVGAGTLSAGSPPVDDSSAPGFAAPAARNPRANAAFVLGIVSLALLVVSLTPCPAVFSCFQPVVAVVAIVLGAMTRRDIDVKGGLEADRKRAQQGLVMGIVALVVFAVLSLIGILLSVGLSVLGEL